MPSSRKKKKVVKHVKKHCICGHGCHDKHAHLPGYLMIAFGLLFLPMNFGLIPATIIPPEAYELIKAWPVALVLFGFVFMIKTALCKIQKTPE